MSTTPSGPTRRDDGASARRDTRAADRDAVDDLASDAHLVDEPDHADASEPTPGTPATGVVDGRRVIVLADAADDVDDGPDGLDGLDGHTIDELTDYLDAGMQPPDPSIDDSPACQNALAAIARVRRVAEEALDVAALDEAEADEDWVGSILANISVEARAGRDIPLRASAPTEHAVITEGAVRALVRRAGDSVEGLLVGRCALEGDVADPSAPIRVRISASVLWGNPIHETADRLRTVVMHELLEHTELVVDGVDVEIRDVLLDRRGTGIGMDDDSAVTAGPATDDTSADHDSADHDSADHGSTDDEEPR